MENSTVTFFNLCGLEESWLSSHYQTSVMFAFIFVTYLFIITLNLTLIITIITEKSLHEPMYIFLCNLCVNSLYGTAGFYPMFLHQLLADVNVISYIVCFIQSFVIHTFTMCEITILSVMAFDRYVAICRPFYYQSILSHLNVGRMMFFAWLYPSLVTFIILSLTLRLPLCGSNIYNVFCNNPSLLKLSCVPNTLNRIWGGIVIIFQTFIVISILYSYCQITRVCLNSTEGRIKFTQTCLPHILTMIIFAIVSLFNILYDQGALPKYVRNVISVQFLVIPPVFNPIIYGLNLKKIRRLIFNKFQRKLKCK